MQDLTIQLAHRRGALAETGDALYGDHVRRLILIVDHPEVARAVADARQGLPSA